MDADPRLKPIKGVTPTIQFDIVDVSIGPPFTAEISKFTAEPPLSVTRLTLMSPWHQGC